MCHNYSTSLLLLSLIASGVAADDLFQGGHLKYQFQTLTFPDDSLYSIYIDSPAYDHNIDLRLKLKKTYERLDLSADYQVVTRNGDNYRLSNSLPPGSLGATIAPNDDGRLFDLTHLISSSNDTVSAHRLDRLYMGYSDQSFVFKFGRQSISWGNGLLFSTMDLFNPFDPTSVDKEYKSGDDMLYMQYLDADGSDYQGVWVFRRDAIGRVAPDKNSIALKYHGFFSTSELDLLIAEHYDDLVIGVGGLTNAGEALFRIDATNTKTSEKNVFSFLTSLSYSWESAGHNMSAIVEYFYNGFGQEASAYTPPALASNVALSDRLSRGELYTLGRQYLASTLSIELSPLWLLSPTVFINLEDSSWLVQVSTTYDIEQDIQLLFSGRLPHGASNSEYGGIDSGVPNTPLETGASLTTQLAVYF